MTFKVIVFVFLFLVHSTIQSKLDEACDLIDEAFSVLDEEFERYCPKYQCSWKALSANVAIKSRLFIMESRIGCLKNFKDYKLTCERLKELSQIPAYPEFATKSERILYDLSKSVLFDVVDEVSNYRGCNIIIDEYFTNDY